MDKSMDRPVEDMRLAQIGFLVNDVEKTKEEFARFFGAEEPETINSGEYEITHTEYRGEPAPKAKCYMTFFYFGDLQMELIQPNGEPSIWWEHLEQFGEGIHRILFNVKEMQKTISVCEDWGMKLPQRGEYRGTNGRYAFMDTLNGLKAMVGLLERDGWEGVR